MSRKTKALMQKYAQMGRKIEEEQPEGEEWLALMEKRNRIGRKVIARIESGVEFTPECIEQIEKNLQGK